MSTFVLVNNQTQIIMKRLLPFFLVVFLTSCEMLEDFTHQFESDDYDYAYMDMKDYPDWDCGIITKDDLYMLIKQDSLSNESVAYVNVKDANTKGIALYFDKDYRLSSFTTEKGGCYLYWTGEETADIHIITDDKNEIIEDVLIPSFPYSETRLAWVPILITAGRGLLTALSIKGAIDLTIDLVTGDFNGVGVDLLEMIAGGKTGKLSTDLISGYGFEWLKFSRGNLDKNLQNCLLGDCQIQVSSDKIGINHYRITVATSGYETMPILNSITGEKSVVIAGVVVRKYFEHVDYSTNDDTLLTFQVDGNNTKTIDFELPENSVYYVAPYLLPTRYGKYNLVGGLRYGNTIRLECFNGHIDSFKQLSCEENNDVYTFECTAHAICNVEESCIWRLYYIDDNGDKTYYNARTYSEPSIGNPNTADFDFQINIASDDIKEGKRAIKLGICVDDVGNLRSIHSDPQTFVLQRDKEEHPHAVDLGLSVKWASCNVGANSPEEYGDYFAWGEISPKSSYTWDNYQHWVLGYDDSGDWYVKYATLNSDISGTQYDAATANWGGSWRMPTKAEIEELLNECNWQWTTQDGVTGMRVTGPNGNSIFLPAAGARDGSSSNYVGSYGFYWSSTPYYDDFILGYRACFLYFRSDLHDWGAWGGRDSGISVRPVSE